MSGCPIIVTFAVPQESSEFRRALGAGQSEQWRVEHIGVGPKIAAERIERVLAQEKPRLVICAGFAGGLDPQLATADLVMAENLSTPEMVVPARVLAPAGARCVFGGVVSRREPVETPEAKAAVFRETGALAVDMESETVAAACRTAGVPLVVVRTISDPAGAALPVPFAEWFDLARQQPRHVALLKYLVLHPGRIGPFAEFVRGLAPARRALTGFLLQYLAKEEPPR